jgi:DNA primase
MEIQEIKNGLTLSQVLKYYNLKPDKQLRLNCPFHDDKTLCWRRFAICA